MKPHDSPINSKIAAVLLSCAMVTSAQADASRLQLTLRSRVKSKDRAKDVFKPTEKKATWGPKETAIIICDMWDDHWCKSAAHRVAELSGPINEVVKHARAKGVFIIHAPSS